MGLRDRIQRQDQENFSYLMLSIIIEKEDFEVNCLYNYKTIWDSYTGIGFREKNHFLLIKLTQLFQHLYFLLKFKNNTLKASYTCYHSECEKTGHIFNRKRLWGFQ